MMVKDPRVPYSWSVKFHPKRPDNRSPVVDAELPPPEMLREETFPVTPISRSRELSLELTSEISEVLELGTSEVDVEVGVELK